MLFGLAEGIIVKQASFKTSNVLVPNISDFASNIKNTNPSARPVRSDLLLDPLSKRDAVCVRAALQDLCRNAVRVPEDGLGTAVTRLKHTTLHIHLCVLSGQRSACDHNRSPRNQVAKLCRQSLSGAPCGFGHA